jgi:L-cystine uptake protein TcyP (sodium:dicarboxylate symporter family)
MFEQLQDYFSLEDSTSNFLQIFQLCSHIAQSHIHIHIVYILRMAQLLAMVKPSNMVHPIAIKNVVWPCLYAFNFKYIFQYIFPFTNLG